VAVVQPLGKRIKIPPIAEEEEEVPKIEEPEVEIPWAIGMVEDVGRQLGGQVIDVPEARVYTPQDIGVTLPEGWGVKLTPAETEQGFTYSLVEPGGWELFGGDVYVSPEGESYSLAQMRRLALAEEWDEFEALPPEEPETEIFRLLGGLFPGREIGEVIEYYFPEVEEVTVTPPPEERIRIEEEQRIATERWGEFLSEIQEIGRTPETESLLRIMFPDISDPELESLLTGEPIPVMEQATMGLGAAWEELTTGGWTWGEVGDVLLGGLGVLGATIETYVQRPWEAFVGEARARFQLAIGQGSPADRLFIIRLDKAWEQHGWGWAFSEDVSLAWEEYTNQLTGPARVATEISEWLNPAYLITLGGIAGTGARMVSRIPVIGNWAAKMAGAVIKTERAVFYPITKPLELTARAAARIVPSAARKIIGETTHLIMKLPKSEAIAADLFASNWMKRVTQRIAKLPLAKPFIRAIDPRLLVRLNSAIVEDVVGRAAGVKLFFESAGRNLRAAKLLELRGVSANPVKLFGFNKEGVSTTIRRLTKDATGTLEDIFIHPGKYALNARQIEYVNRTHELFTGVTDLLITEGVAPKGVTAEWWVHRVVMGKYNKAGELILVRGKPGVKGGGLGAKRAYEMRRKAPTMDTGIEWGIRYSPNPEEWIGTYIEEAFKKIGDERFALMVAEYGTKPSVILAERAPELVARAELTQAELAGAAKFESVINRAIRGERLPEATLKAMEKQFPELGYRLRYLTKEPTTVKALGKYIETLKRYPEKPGRLPSDHRMAEAFSVMPFEERLAYRYVIEDLAVKTGDKGAKRILKALDSVDTLPRYTPSEGLPKDMFGYPQKGMVEGVARVTRLSADDYTRLVELHKRAGLPPPDVALKPMIEGIEAETIIKKVAYELPPVKTGAERLAALNSLKLEAKALKEARRGPFWQAKSEKALEMEKIRQPGIEHGYIMQPMFGGRLYDREFIDVVNMWFGHKSGLKALRFTSDLAGILRITKAALDFSWQAIQGMPSFGLAHAYLLINPPIGVKLMGQWYRGFWYSVNSFFRPEVFYKMMKGKFGKLSTERIGFGGSSQAIDYFEVLGAKTGFGGFGAKALRRIPLDPFGRAEVAWLSGGEYVRNTFWEILAPSAIKRGQEFQLVRFLDRMTGIIDTAGMGVPQLTRQLESSFMWFAPRYTRACASVLASIFRGGYTGQMARKALGGMVSAGVLYYSALQYGLATLEGKSHDDAWDSVLEGFGVVQDPITKEWGWKPSARFMTIKIGNYYMGLGSFWYGLLRLSGNIMATVNEVGDREIIDFIKIIKNGSVNRDNPFVYWWFTRTSPVTSNIVQLAEHRDFLGYPIESVDEYLMHIAKMFEPIWLEQGVNPLVFPSWSTDAEIPEGLARQLIIPAELFGLRTFPESGWVRFYDKAKEYIPSMPREELDEAQIGAWRDDKLEWAHLTDVQKMNLLARYSDLNDLYIEAQADSAVRDSGIWGQWQEVMAESKEIYYDRINQLTGQLIMGEIDTREYRDMAGEAGQMYGVSLETIERDPTYSDIYNYFAKKEEEEDKYGFLDDIAMAEYSSRILFAEDMVDIDGNYDWDERDRRISDFIEKWGLATYERILKYYEEKKRIEGLNEVWLRKAHDTELIGRDYWDLPWKPIIDISLSSDVPAPYLPLWQTYISLKTDEEREAFIVKHPDFTRDWRTEYRIANSNIDAMLALWGYGGNLQSAEAYNLVEKWGAELGIPLDQMGLGLPPRNLVKNYFEYKAISAEHGGNSREAKGYRYDNPEFDEWGQENWGWKPARKPKEEAEEGYLGTLEDILD